MKTFSYLVELFDLLPAEKVNVIFCKNEVELTNLITNYDKMKYQLGNIHNLGIVEGIKETDIVPFLKKEEGLEIGTTEGGTNNA
jgi:hypothetical protein